MLAALVALFALPSPRLSARAAPRHSPRLPPPVWPHFQRAHDAVRAGSVDAALPHLDAALRSGGGSLGGAAATRAAYGRLIKLSRRACGPHAAAELLAHLTHAAATPPDRATAHLVVSDLVYRSRPAAALRLLASLAAARAPLSTGSFDVLIHGARRAGDRALGFAAYRQLRRARLRPTAYTLNAMLELVGQTGGADEAARLLRRALGGAPRWRGAPPDAWTWSAAIAIAARARRPELARRLHLELLRRRDVQPNIAAYNAAIHAHFLAGRPARAALLYRRVRDGRGGAPRPRADTFNTMINGQHRAGLPIEWVVHEMAAAGVRPDVVTVCSLLRMQKDLKSTMYVWRWGRKHGVAKGRQAWHHLAEGYLRHGAPERVHALIGRMEAEGEPADVRSHNLYLRSLIATARPEEALAHIEAMAAAPRAAGRGATPRRGGREVRRAAGAPPRLALASADSSAWNATLVPPDECTFNLGLVAIRQLGDAAAPSREPDLQRARRAVQLVQLAKGQHAASGPPSAVRAHSLLTAAGAEPMVAFAIWNSELRESVLKERKAAPRGQQPDGEASLERACIHALMRVCGIARDPQSALRIITLLRKDGLYPDGTCYSAYLKGKAVNVPTSAQPRALQAGVELLRSGYERLLQLECCPEKVGVAPGGIERIRVVW